MYNASCIYRPGLLSGKHEKQLLYNMFERFQKKCAQAPVSEYMNLHNYKINKQQIKIRKMLGMSQWPPFEFVYCLN
jgi:hypothetical protein